MGSIGRFGRPFRYQYFRIVLAVIGNAAQPVEPVFPAGLIVDPGGVVDRNQAGALLHQFIELIQPVERVSVITLVIGQGVLRKQRVSLLGSPVAAALQHDRGCRRQVQRDRPKGRAPRYV